MSETAKWFVVHYRTSEVKGPYTFAELQRLANAESLSSACLVRNAAMKHWRPARQIWGLKLRFACTPTSGCVIDVGSDKCEECGDHLRSGARTCAKCTRARKWAKSAGLVHVLSGEDASDQFPQKPED
jgi:hypothetical protein